MSFPRILFVLAVLAATPAAADPATWSKATMAAAPTYFPAGSTAMVIGVGESAQPAAAALLGSLQSSDAFELVSDGRALGKVDELADEDIVKRAFTRPIKRVAIVRVFPAGASVKAVVTVYAAQGQVSTAFTLAPGKSLAENPNPKAAADGVARDEMQSVENTTAGGGSGGDGDITYQRQQLVGVTGYGVVSLENVMFYQNGRMISDTPSLYSALGMEDKATTYRKGQANHDKWVKRGAYMTTIGITGLLTFGTWALIAGNSNTFNPDGSVTPGSATLQWGLTAASAGLMIAGIYVWAANPAPATLTADEAVSLVDAHNAKKKHTSELHFVPTASSQGAGMMLLGSF